MLLLAVLHFLPGEQEPYDVIRRLLADLPEGSYVVLSHATGDHMPPGTKTDIEYAYQGRFRFRSLPEARRSFDGMELVEPGIVSVADWRRGETDPLLKPEEVSCYGGVACVF